MKHFIVFVAALLSASVPILASDRKSGTGVPPVSYAQEVRGATNPRTRSVRRKRRLVRRRCRPVAIAQPKGDAITTPTGLTYIITRRSQERQALPGETVIVNYTGLLSSGVKFDSSLDRGKPFEFPLGKGRVIKGWDEGIAQLRIGEQATLIIPPRLGYGERGAGGIIPPNATLVFLVEVVGIREAPQPNP